MKQFCHMISLEKAKLPLYLVSISSSFSVSIHIDCNHFQRSLYFQDSIECTVLALLNDKYQFRKRSLIGTTYIVRSTIVRQTLVRVSLVRRNTSPPSNKIRQQSAHITSTTLVRCDRSPPTYNDRQKSAHILSLSYESGLLSLII